MGHYPSIAEIEVPAKTGAARLLSFRPKGAILIPRVNKRSLLVVRDDTRPLSETLKFENNRNKMGSIYSGKNGKPANQNGDSATEVTENTELLFEK